MEQGGRGLDSRPVALPQQYLAIHGVTFGFTVLSGEGELGRRICSLPTGCQVALPSPFPAGTHKLQGTSVF